MSESGTKQKAALRLGAVGAVAALLMSLGISAASADVSVGQVLSNKGYSCGSNERITGGLVLYGPVPTKQHAMIYRNCSSKSVKRKADVKFDRDGSCISIPAGKTKVLHVVQALPSRDVYRNAKSC